MKQYLSLECKLYSCLPSTTWEQAERNRHTHASTNLDNRVHRQTQCVGFVWQGFGSGGGATGVTPGRSCLEASPAPRRTCIWPRLSQLATVVVPLGEHI